MKKTISINIGGIIFHIEEDGFEKLKSYLDSVNAYFSSFDDSAEIIADIEARIAEIFLEKLADGRQTVNLEDVNDLIATMGTTSDFEATIESEPQEEPADQEEKESPKDEPDAASAGESKPKKLYRDSKRRILGGVASGMAHYFGIDPLWVRLLFVILFINLLFPGFSGATFLAYIILWIVLPPSDELEDDKKIKKLFRNTEDRVIGGVSSGIASYFGTDKSVIRLLFVLSIFLGGAGIILYIILWLITPEARTITEKMQMQGEPVTLSNIEDNVKKGLNVREGEESPLVKVLLFPFRLIALIINGLGKILGPALKFLVELIRIAFGVILVIIGFSMMLAFVSAILTIFGLTSWSHFMQMGSIPIELIQRSIDSWAILSIFLISFIPALAIALAGVSVIIKRAVTKAYVGWSLFGIWVFSLIFSAFAIPSFVAQFTSEEEIRSELTFPLTNGTPTLRLNELSEARHLDNVRLKLRGHADSTYSLLLSLESRGSSRDEAKQNASMVSYNVQQKADDFIFDSNVTFSDSAIYRFQNAYAVFYIPYGKEFKMDYELKEILINTLHTNGYSSRHLRQNNTWVFERTGLKCVTCNTGRSHLDDDEDDQRSSRPRAYEDRIDYPFENFDEIKVASLMDVEIIQGENWQVTLRGGDDELDDVYLNQIGDALEVKFREDNWKWWNDQGVEKISLLVTMPELEYLELTGACEGEVKGFTNKEMSFNLVGASKLYANVNPEELEINLMGASQMEVRGSSRYLEANVVGASKLQAHSLEAERAEVTAAGASTAEVFASGELDIEAVGVSKVKYRGTNNVSIREEGMSKVERD
ncbi:PspC domain-containing protein [Marinoscillum furvescens]|uniref:Phage shock protein C (PspC) family protein n=1 Tax=Marinoscillum furvescens DSM 4134 TaxID=1122208 RepID=A0A3D9L331_MARFU|nr:PspC domain-containing protein [Marinoscillum furvescens]RED99443.1 phage shock protein C (PspC) family protein [Marinoscillum furvescens DSM 4134]